MQDIQDRDFNTMFQQKFENFTVEPNSAVWRGIVSELQFNGQKKPFPVFRAMAVAASVLFVLSTALWLFSPKEKIRLYGKSDLAAIQDEPQDVKVSSPAVNRAGKKLSSSEKIPLSSINNEPVVERSSVNPPAVEKKEAETLAPRPEEAPVKEIEMAKLDNKVLQNKKANSMKDIPVLALVNEQFALADTKKYTTPQPHVKTMGDIVNFVVGKIDPREDKIIQFRDDGDDGSEVSGINLGLLKFKSRNKQN